jgi:histone H3/H4
MEKETMPFVVCPTTMKRIIKHKTGLSRVECAAAVVFCDASEKWIERMVKRCLEIATRKSQRTIDVDTVQRAMGDQVKVGKSTREWCKTRARDRIKALSPGFRWSLHAKRAFYEAFEQYIQLLCQRIAATQRLAGRMTINEQHVIAAVKMR